MSCLYYVKQTDPELLPEIRAVGCFFRSSLHCVELAKHLYLTPTAINELWIKARGKGIIDADNNLKDSAKLMNLALGYLDENDGSYFAEIGISHNNKPELYPWADRKGLVPDYFIQKMLQGGKSVYHFVNVDKSGNLVFEPHEPAIKNLGEVYTICYKFFDL